jgi:hypothetical protein
MCQGEYKKGRRHLPKARPFARYDVFELISRGASFCDPHPAFSAAICVQLTVAGARGDGTCQTHQPAAAGAQMR